MKRGEIWWVDLGEPRGSEPGYRRPGVIVSADTFNVSALSTVIVALVTTNERLAGMPGNVALAARGTGLSRPSVVNVTQIATVDRADLVQRIGRVPPALMRQLDDGLRLALGV